MLVYKIIKVLYKVPSDSEELVPKKDVILRHLWVARGARK